MKRALRSSLALIAILALGGLANRASAQTASSGALNGTVSDASGGVVPGATITVTNESSGAVRTVVSGSEGTYLVPLLPPGSYSVEVSRTGFKVALHTSR